MTCGYRPRSACPSRSCLRGPLQVKEQRARPAGASDASGHFGQGGIALAPILEALVRHLHLVSHAAPGPGEDRAGFYASARQGRVGGIRLECPLQAAEAMPNIGRQIAMYSGLQLIGQPPTQQGRAVMRWHVTQDLVAKLAQILKAEIVQTGV